jgi:hypothetical protein
MGTGTEHWEIEHDALIDVFEKIADEHAADWESTIDGLAIVEGYIPPSPAVPMDLRVYLIETVRPPRMAVAS